MHHPVQPTTEFRPNTLITHSSIPKPLNDSLPAHCSGSMRYSDQSAIPKPSCHFNAPSCYNKTPHLVSGHHLHTVSNLIQANVLIQCTIWNQITVWLQPTFRSNSLFQSCTTVWIHSPFDSSAPISVHSSIPPHSLDSGHCSVPAHHSRTSVLFRHWPLFQFVYLMSIYLKSDSWQTVFVQDSISVFQCYGGALRDLRIPPLPQIICA